MIGTMLLAVDASVLVAEFLRELERRLSNIVEQNQLSPRQAMLLRQPIQTLIAKNVIEVVPAHGYQHLEATARRRVPCDPNDWPTVALALALGASVLTEDHDFLGCGCATWTFETLRSELAEQE